MNTPTTTVPPTGPRAWKSKPQADVAKPAPPAVPVKAPPAADARHKLVDKSGNWTVRDDAAALRDGEATRKKVEGLLKDLAEARERSDGKLYGLTACRDKQHAKDVLEWAKKQPEAKGLKFEIIRDVVWMRSPHPMDGGFPV